MHIEKLKLNDQNPRHISQDKLEKLKKSINEFPEMMSLRPIIVNKDYIVIGGNMRLTALLQLGYKEIPDEWVKIGNLQDEQQKRFIIADNVGFGEWDWETLSNKWDVADLEKWGLDIPNFETNEELEASEDDYDVPEGGIETDIVIGDLFEIGEHRLLCGDSTDASDVAFLFDGKLADMVMTDPPYNVDYASKNKMLNYSDKGARIQDDIENDKMDDNSFYQFLYDFYTALGTFTKQGGSWYVWHTDNERINFTKAFQDAGMYFSQCLIWVKNNLVLGRLDYQKKHETCLYGWKEGAGHYFTNQRTNTTVIEDKLDIKKLTKDEMKKMLTEMLSDKTKSTIIHCDKPHQSDLHPTMKPILLLAPLIENSSRVGEIVADGFLGSGSTMVAAHQLKRRCYGMELDPKYCQVIIDRMKKLDPTLIIKRNGINYER